MFKRLRVLALTLGLLLVFSAAAWAAEVDVVLFESSLSWDGGASDVYVEAAAVVNDTLYISASDDLYSYKLGDAEPVKLMRLRAKEPPEWNSASGWGEPATPAPVENAEPVPVDSIEGVTAEVAAPVEYDWNDRLAWPFAYQGELYMIHVSTGTIRVLKDEAFVDSDIRIDPPEDLPEDYVFADCLTSIFEADGTLYALVRTDFEDWDAALELWKVDPKTGGHTKVETEFPINGVCGYGPGKLLAWTRPLWGSIPGEYKAEDYYPKLFTFDAATGNTLEEPVLANESSHGDPCGIFYDAETDAIYYVVQNQLLRRASLEVEAETVSYLTRDINQTNGIASLMGGTHIVIPTYNGVHVRNLRVEPASGGALKIANYYMSEAATLFMRANPDIPLVFVDFDDMYGASADEIAQMIGAGEDSVDIYVIYTGSAVRQLMEKGYAQDLSGSQVISDAFGHMYASIREALSAEGKPVTFPTYIYSSLWSYNKERFDEFGLEPPNTYGEYIDLYQRWTKEFKEQNPSVHLTSNYSVPENDFKRSMFTEIFYAYIREFDTPGEPIAFNTPEFLTIMGKVEALPGTYEVTEGDYMYEFDESATFLLEQYFGLESYWGYGQRFTPFPAPRISADSEPTVTLTMGLFFVNPNSANMENAIKFLEYMVENCEYSGKLILYPDYNELQKNEWAAQEIEEAEKELVDVKAMEVTEENRREVEEMLKSAEERLSRAKWEEWRVRQETLDAYRELVADLPFAMEGDSFLLSSEAANKEVNDIVERYLNGQLSLEQMARELDQKTQMIYLEQQ